MNVNLYAVPFTPYHARAPPFLSAEPFLPSGLPPMSLMFFNVTLSPVMLNILQNPLALIANPFMLRVKWVGICI